MNLPEIKAETKIHCLFSTWIFLKVLDFIFRLTIASNIDSFLKFFSINHSFPRTTSTS